MQSVMMRISTRSRDTLRELAAQTGEPMQKMIDEAVEIYRRRRFLEEVNAAYLPVRQNPKTWGAVAQERSEWDATLEDGLEIEAAQKGDKSEHRSRERKKSIRKPRPR